MSERWTRWMGGVCALVGLALGAGACALPTSSFARPVRPVKDGAGLVSAGAMVPFASFGTGPDDSGTATAFDPLAVWPYVAGDARLSERWSLGVSTATFVSLPDNADGSSDTTGFPVFVVPRLEYRGDALSFAMDVTVWFLGEGSDGFLVFPSAGVRYYHAVGDVGGVVITQQVGTLIFSSSLPGSVAWDLAIEAGSTRVHVFPELRWDPTWFSFDNDSYFVTLLSAGLTLMVEL